MMKSFSPLLLNIIMMIIIMAPSKSSKFHPLMMMTLLIFFTLSISINMNLLNKSWLPYIMFLIIVGGLLVIFMYMTSLVNNKLFKFNKNTSILLLYKIMLMSVIIFLLLYFFKTLNFNNYNMLMENSISISNSHKMFYMKYYNYSTMFMMAYMYYTMIIIMEICFIYKSPLRLLKF